MVSQKSKKKGASMMSSIQADELYSFHAIINMFVAF